MPAAKPDRRTERTRQALMSAFVQLVLTRGYEQVTVEEIAARANTGRSTFYMHYRGKEHILKQSLTRPSSALAITVGHDMSPEMLAPALAHFHAQRTVNRVFLAEPMRPIWVKCLAGLIEPRLATLARHVRAEPILPLGLIATQIAEAQIALIANWLTAKPSLKPLVVGEALIAATRAMTVALLRPLPGAPLLIPGEKLRVIED
jgi:AcrR family transcriptional regulator